MNKNFGKLENDKITYAPSNVRIGDTIWANPTAAQYLAAGWKAVDASQPDEAAEEGYHYEPDGWAESSTTIWRTWKKVADVATARRWTRLKLKTALAEKGWLAQVKAALGGVEIADGYTAWEALTDCDYVEENWPTAARWGATLDGVAAAIGKTRAEVDAFLDGVETEA